MYRYDPDLEFLGKVESEDLNDLVQMLLYDKDGDARLTEELSMRDSYKRYHPDHHQSWEDIAGEIQCYGANTIAMWFRGGKGVLYKEILCDVCDSLKANYNENASVERIENCLLMGILEKSLEEMSAEEINELGRNLGLKNKSSITPEMILASCQTAFKLGGFVSYKLAMIVANAVWKALFGRGLSLAVNNSINKVLSVWAGPIGWAVTIVWTALDIAGPAKRITIPAVIQIALLRRKLNAGDNVPGIGDDNLPILVQ